MNRADSYSTEHAARRRELFRRCVKRLRPDTSDGSGFILYLLVWSPFIGLMMSGWKSDLAVWSQAAFASATVAGAVGIAVNQARRTRRMRREQYQEAAWYGRLAITQAQSESQLIAAALVNRTAPLAVSEIRDWQQRVATAAIGLSSLAIITDHSNPSVTQIMANTKLLVDDLVADLALLARFVEEGKQPDDDLVARIASRPAALLELSNLSDTPMRGIHIEPDNDDDALPINRWAS